MAEHRATMEAALARNTSEAIRLLNAHISLTAGIVARAEDALSPRNTD